MRVVRVYEEPDDTYCVLREVGATDRYKGFDTLPDEIKGNLAVLRTAPVGYWHEDIGRSIGDGVFWVYVNE